MSYQKKKNTFLKGLAYPDSDSTAAVKLVVSLGTIFQRCIVRARAVHH